MIMRSSSASGPGKITGKVNSEIACQTTTPSARVINPGDIQLSVRFTTVVPRALVAQDQGVLLLVRYVFQDAVLLDQF